MLLTIVQSSSRIAREEYRERTLVQSAKRLRRLPAAATLDMTTDLIDSTWSLHDAGEASIVRRRR